MAANSSSSSSSEPPFMPKSDEDKEEILDRMLTRLALCDDSKLEGLVSKLLPTAISSLSTNSPAIRNKVILLFYLPVQLLDFSSLLNMFVFGLQFDLYMICFQVGQTVFSVGTSQGCGDEIFIESGSLFRLETGCFGDEFLIESGSLDLEYELYSTENSPYCSQ